MYRKRKFNNFLKNRIQSPRHIRNLAKEEYMLNTGEPITGTMVWFSAICPRAVWLSSRNIEPDPENMFLDLGKAIHETHISGANDITGIEGIKIDLKRGNEICELKSSSRNIEAAKLQLSYYLFRLRVEGREMKGRISIPRERLSISVRLDNSVLRKLMASLKSIREICAKDEPLTPKRIPFCKRCSYMLMCWS